MLIYIYIYIYIYTYALSVYFVLVTEPDNDLLQVYHPTSVIPEETDSIRSLRLCLNAN
jgi:hypothetical protein